MENSKESPVLYWLREPFSFVLLISCPLFYLSLPASISLSLSFHLNISSSVGICCVCIECAFILLSLRLYDKSWWIVVTEYTRIDHRNKLQNIFHYIQCHRHRTFVKKFQSFIWEIFLCDDLQCDMLKSYILYVSYIIQLPLVI